MTSQRGGDLVEYVCRVEEYHKIYFRHFRLSFLRLSLALSSCYSYELNIATANQAHSFIWHLRVAVESFLIWNGRHPQFQNFNTSPGMQEIWFPLWLFKIRRGMDEKLLLTGLDFFPILMVVQKAIYKFSTSGIFLNSFHQLYIKTLSNIGANFFWYSTTQETYYERWPHRRHLHAADNHKMLCALYLGT